VIHRIKRQTKRRGSVHRWHCRAYGVDQKVWARERVYLDQLFCATGMLLEVRAQRAGANDYAVIANR
jgi:hypothetical protein